MTIVVSLACPDCGYRQHWREGDALPVGDIVCPNDGAVMNPATTTTEEELAERNQVVSAAATARAITQEAPETVLKRLLDLEADCEAAERELKDCQEETKEARKGYDAAVKALREAVHALTDRPAPKPLLVLAEAELAPGDIEAAEETTRA